MAISSFKASAKYGDWSGTSSADSADMNYLYEWLRAQGHMKPDEFLLGVEMITGENAPGKHQDPIYVNFVLVDKKDFESVKAMLDTTDGPIPVRKVSVHMQVTEFLGLFKRFEVAFSAHDLLGTREIEFRDQ